jgi:Kef-type K+ transport system membrane component KefB
VLTHVSTNVLYVVIAMTVLPSALRRMGRARWNVLARNTPIAWILVVLLAYVSAAAALDVTLAFAAFLAGFGIVGGMTGSEHARFRPSLDSVGGVSLAVFIPIYFAMVGYRLDFSQDFSALMLFAFLLASSLVRVASVGAAAWFAGFRRLDILNLAVTFNARGGPGIVLASVALDAGIISAAFYTTLVVTAVLTSQVCGSWLDLVVRKGWPLLAADGPVRAEATQAPRSSAPAQA